MGMFQTRRPQVKEAPDISVDLCGIKLDNPLMLASGVIGEKFEKLENASHKGFGAVVSKSIGIHPRNGYPDPTTHSPFDGSLLAASGLKNDGIDSFLEHLKDCDTGAPIIGSIFGQELFEIEHLASKLDGMVPIIELNISCPHSDPGAKRGVLVSQSPDMTRKFVSAAKGIMKKSKLSVKLTSEVVSIVEIARAALDGGADAITVINTVRALDIDINTQNGTISNTFGGLSGRAIRCIGLRIVAELSMAMHNGDLNTAPILAVGGVEEWDDVVKYILLGASCVQIGTAYNNGLLQIMVIRYGIEQYMAEHGYKTIKDFRGNAMLNINK